MKQWWYLIKTIRRFGIKDVCNAASDLYPTSTESVGEYSGRTKNLKRRTI